MRTFFSLLRYFNNHTPSRIEVKYCNYLIETYDDIVPLTIRITKMMKEYASGYSLKEVADIHMIPEQRVRPCIMKGCWVAYGLRNKRTTG